MRDDFTKFPTISQWFQTLIHPALMQRRFLDSLGSFVNNINRILLISNN
ncbi:MAG: hypothetical protein HRU34_10845 [Richelia sp.]|nr:hypothetical protein [Richelia sp.]CDN12162.1 hypothetical protein RintRC_2391 [Richelia intracellularis]